MTAGVTWEEMRCLPGTNQAEEATGVAWEEVPCPLCRGEDAKSVLECRSPAVSVPCRLVRCQRCRMVYLNPRPDPSSLGRLYPEEYDCYRPPQRPTRWWPTAYLRQLATAYRNGTPLRGSGPGERVLAALVSPWFGRCEDSMTALPYHGAGRLLDYGCGAGWYAHRMRRLGWDVTAMDFSPHAVAQVRRLFGIPTVAGTLPHPEILPASFDVITMGAVLEHVPEPHQVIAAAFEALRPGGYLVVSVPNFAGWGCRHFDRHWWGLQLPHHLLHFTPDTLRQLLTSHGLEVRTLKVVGMAGWMRRSLAEARNKGRRGLAERVCRGRLTTGLLARWTAWTGQADCIVARAYRPDTPLAA